MRRISGTIRTPLGSALAAHPDGARGVLINGGEGMWEPLKGGECAVIPGFNVEGLVLQMSVLHHFSWNTRLVTCPDRCSHVSYQLITQPS